MHHTAACAILLSASLCVLAACSSGRPPGENAETPQQSQPASSVLPSSTASAGGESELRKRIYPNSDVRNVQALTAFYPDMKDDHILENGAYDPSEIPSLWFNEGTVFEGNEELAAKILEDGKNPGLGIRDLHEQGITGKGINVAIIDANLFLNHQEYAGKVVAYHTVYVEDPTLGSMHGPGVTSLLVGSDIGTAPDASVYYAAVPPGAVDGIVNSQYYADALLWIIEQNKKLPEQQKIRVVSISAMPDEPGRENRQSYRDAVALAQNDDILVIDADSFVWSAYYDYGNDPENVQSYKAGYPIAGAQYLSPRKIAAPASLRTTAEQYTQDSQSYAYYGNGGVSWAVPYTAGVLAMGWQVNPALGKDEMVGLLFDTAYTNPDGAKIINPPAYIEAVRETL